MASIYAVVVYVTAPLMTINVILWACLKLGWVPHWRRVLAGVSTLVLGYCAHTWYKEKDMKTLIYLIPEQFFGKVIAVFDQPDGVALADEGDAYTVQVPENGLIKIKNSAELKATYAKVPGSKRLFMNVDSRGQRSIMPISISTAFSNTDRRLANGEYAKDDYLVYRDLDGKLQEKVFPQPHGLYEITMMQAIFGDKTRIAGGASILEYQFMPPGASPADKGGDEAALAKRISAPVFTFSVDYPARMEAWPEWMRIYKKDFSSMAELENTMNDILAKKRAHYNLAPWVTATQPLPGQVPPAIR